MLKSIKETFESVINMDSNTYINRLTMWNIILVVPTVIVGYYGMNMELPFAENEQTATAIFCTDNGAADWLCYVQPDTPPRSLILLFQCG